jgi:hypothetical protein
MAHGDEIRDSRNHLLLRQGILIVPTMVLALNYWFVGARVDLHVDEYTTWFVGMLSWREFWQNRLENGHMPLWFLLSMLVRPLTGETEVGLRAPAGVLWMAALLIPLLLVRAGLGRRTAALAFALIALNQVALWAALNARPSVLLMLGGGVVLLGGEMARRWGGKRSLMLTAGGSLVGMASGAAFAGTALGYAIYVLWDGAGRSCRRWLTIAVMTGPLLCLPLLGVLAVTQKKYDEPRTAFQLNPERYIAPLGNVVLGEDYPQLRLGLAVLFLAGMVAGARRHPVGAGGAALFLGTWATLALAQLLTSHSVLGHARYFAPGLIGGLVAFSLGLEAWARRGRRLLKSSPSKIRCLAYLCGIGVLTTLVFGAGWNSRAYAHRSGDGVRDMTAALLKRMEFPTVLPAGAPFEYEFARQGGTERYRRALLTPRGSDSTTSDSVNRMLDSIWASREIFFLVVYNNKPDPLDGRLKNPPAGWTKSEPLRFGDTRASLMMPAERP